MLFYETSVIFVFVSVDRTGSFIEGKLGFGGRFLSNNQSLTTDNSIIDTWAINN
jgi:hypothetical protein